VAPQGRTTTTIGEAAAVVAICFGMFILGSLRAAATGFPAAEGTFSNASLLWLASTELALGGAALGFLSWRRFSVQTLVPRPTTYGSAWGVGLFLGAWFISWVVVAPFLPGQPQQPINRMVLGSAPALPVVALMAVVNGTFEEVFLLGFLLRGLRSYGLSVALGVSLLVRVLYHLYQGPIGALSVFAVGLTFGLYYVCSLQLWPPVLAHVLFDIAPFLLGEP